MLTNIEQEFQKISDYWVSDLSGYFDRPSKNDYSVENKMNTFHYCFVSDIREKIGLPRTHKGYSSYHDGYDSKGKELVCYGCSHIADKMYVATMARDRDSYISLLSTFKGHLKEKHGVKFLDAN